jgi:hypothetical protein
MVTPTNETRTQVAFPSDEFFQALADRMNSQEAKYKKIGWVDLRLGVRVLPDDTFREEKLYGLVFDTYTCEQAREIAAPTEVEAECVVEGPYWAWKEMFENIATHGKADATHTFNYLTLTEWPLKLTGEDQLGIDKVFRYNFSLQLFWEEAAELDITYPA